MQVLVLESEVPCIGRSAVTMDVDAIRSRFIQENLRCALLEKDRERAARALRAFRLYYQWFENRVPDREKLSIVSQLARLEEAYSNEPAHRDRASTGQASER
jgi:hypothetical protein